MQFCETIITSKRLIIKSLCLTICFLTLVSCQLSSATNSDLSIQPTIVVTKVVSESIEPSPTPAICTPDLDGVDLSVESISPDSANVQLNGLQPNERVTLLFVAQPTAAQSSEKEISFTVESDGTLSHQERSLTKLDDATENIWTVKVIHSRGVTCEEFTLP